MQHEIQQYRRTVIEVYELTWWNMRHSYGVKQYLPLCWLKINFFACLQCQPAVRYCRVMQDSAHIHLNSRHELQWEGLAKSLTVGLVEVLPYI